MKFKKVVFLIVCMSLLHFFVNAQGLNEGPVTTVSGLNVAVGDPWNNKTLVRQRNPSEYYAAIAYNKNDSLAIGNKKVQPANANHYWFALAKINGLNTNWAFSYASPIGGNARGFNIEAMEIRDETPMGIPFLYVAGGMSTNVGDSINFNPLGTASKISTNGQFNAVVAKYNGNNGTLAWAKVFSGSDGYITTIAPAFGDTILYVAGVYTNTLTVDNITLTSTSIAASYGQRSIFFGALSSNTGKVLWLNQIDGGLTPDYRPLAIKYNFSNQKLFIMGTHRSFSNFGNLSLNSVKKTVFFSLFNTTTQQFEMAKQVEFDNTDNVASIVSCVVNKNIVHGNYIGLTISHEKAISIDTLSYPAPYMPTSDIKSYLFWLQDNGTASNIHAFEADKMHIYKVLDNPVGVIGYLQGGNLSFGNKTLTDPYQFFAFFNSQWNPCYLQTFKNNYNTSYSLLDIDTDALNFNGTMHIMGVGKFYNANNNFGTKQDMILPYDPNDNNNLGIVKYRYPMLSTAFVQVYDSLTASWNEINLYDYEAYNLGTVPVNQTANGQIKIKNLFSDPADTLYFCDTPSQWINNMGAFSANLSKNKVGYQTDSLIINVSGTPSSANLFQASLRLEYVGGFNTYILRVTGTTTTARALTSEKMITLFPNPAEDFLNLHCDGCDNIPLNYSIYDAVGKLVQKGIITTNDKLPVQTLTPGMYFIEIESTNEVFRARFVKQ